jgi:hypothetical protein
MDNLKNTIAYRILKREAYLRGRREKNIREKEGMSSDHWNEDYAREWHRNQLKSELKKADEQRISDKREI